MMPMVEILVGGTINLGHYENLKIEIRGPAGSQDDVLAARNAFREAILGFGREDDPEIMAALRSYADRVVPLPEPSAEQEQETPVAEQVETSPPIDPEAGKIEAKNPAEGIGSGFVCSSCGKQITSNEERASRLFVSRPVCTGCLKSGGWRGSK